MRRLSALLLLALPSAALAVGAPADDAATLPPGSLHQDAPEEIVVTAPYLRDRADLLSGVSVLTGPRLIAELRPSIGETLTRQPGVSATSFGPNASRPILRGLQGERIRVLTDGIGAFDVSNTSVDHAVVINPLLADRIEVIRGPASLLYGSAAIGGVVNVTDRRIAREVPAEAVHVDATGTLGSAASERSGGASFDVPLGGGLVFHADGSYSKTNDLRIGGFLLSEPARATALANGLTALANARGRLPNSGARTWDAAAGLSVINDGGAAGFAVSRYESLYGVPARFDLTTGEGEGVRLDMKQTRVDARAEVNAQGLLETVRFRFGWADYNHVELEPDGSAGTLFLNQGLEARLELVQRERGGWRGASGVQLFQRRFDVVGDEAFVPKNETRQLGLFTLQEVTIGPVKAEFGGRVERTDSGAPGLGIDRRFDAISLSAGGSVAVAPGWRLGVNLSRTERAPSPEELFANGPHAGTQAFEIGDPAFSIERATGAEAVLRGSAGGVRVEASAYYTRFHDFIYDQRTGEVRDDLPVFQFRQADARFYGFEAEASATFARVGETDLSADLLADYTNAAILGIGPAPRIPPFRLLGGIEANGPAWGARVEVERASRQTRVATFETPTAGWTLVNASAHWRPFGDANRTTILLSANNIFDVDARRHASFLKDYAPLAGRDIRLTVRLAY